MIVLHTDVVSELFRAAPQPKLLTWLEQPGDDLAITMITLAELLAGLRRLPDGKRKTALRRAIEVVADAYRGTDALLPFDEAAAAEYAEVLALRREAGLATSTADAQIAAICRARGATCATRDTRDLLESGVELIDPWSLER